MSANPPYANPAKKWTGAAIDCFERGSLCSGCFFDEFFQNSPHFCRMNEAVERLLDVVGPPPSKLIPREDDF